MFAIKYFAPKTVEEACAMLANYKKEAKVIAGGTDLVVQMKHGEVLPRYIINIGDIAGQDYIIYDERAGLRIGAQTTIHSIACSSLTREHFGILTQAASQLGSAPIRRRATIGGNLCNAAPSAEVAPALIVLGASLRIVAVGKERVVPIEDFFIGPGQIVLEPGEIVAEIQVPNLAPRSSGIYIKHTIRNAMDLAIVGVAVIVTVDGDILSEVKIALGAVAPTPIRARVAEGILQGQKINDDLLQKVGQAAADESRPIDDVRSSAEYRRKMVKVLTARAVKQAVEQAQANY